MQAPRCVDGFSNELRERHPSWEIIVYAGRWGRLNEPVAFLNASKKWGDGEWYESPIMFVMDFSPQQMESAKDELVKWEQELTERVGN